MKMKTILMLTDFSIRADNATDFALKLAQVTRCKLLLCNMFLVPFVEPMTVQMAWPLENYNSLEEESKSDLAAVTARLTNKLDYDNNLDEFKPEIEQRSLSGSIAEIFSEISSKNDLLMAVISQHDTLHSEGFVFENHAKRIIEKAKFPVLVVPESARFIGFKNIAFATDLSLSDVDILHRLITLAKGFNANITVTHINDENALDADEARNVEHFFNMVSAEIKYPGLLYKAVKSDTVEKGLNHFAANTEVDLLVLVHRKRNFFYRLFEGSVTHKIAGHLRLPLLVLPHLNESEGK